MGDRRRNIGQERMDSDAFSRQDAIDTFRYLTPVNRLFGGIRPVISFLKRESRSWSRGQVYHILDAGCGAGDVAVAIARWARRNNHRIEIDAVDDHQPTLELARDRCAGYPEIHPHHGDVFSQTENRYDYVHASQFLHHFPDAEVPAVLGALREMSNRRLLVNDLIYAPLHYLATWALTLFTSSVFRHDARLSVRRGFQIDSLEQLLRRHDLNDYRIEKHFLYRVLLIMDGTSHTPIEGVTPQ